MMKETVTSPKSKDEAARELAESHFRVEPYMLHIFRLLHKDRGREQYPEEPIKLLEVNPETITAGIQPIRFGPHAPSGLLFSSIIVEIRPEEYDDLLRGKLSLPDTWRIGAEYTCPRRTSACECGRRVPFRPNQIWRRSESRAMRNRFRPGGHSLCR